MDPNEPARRHPHHLLWLIPAVLLLAGAGIFLVSRRDGGNLATSKSSPTTPAFAFRLEKVAPVSVTSADPSKLIGPARTAAQGIKRIIDQLYTEAFLVPSNWTTGSYANVWPLFSGGAVAGAKAHMDSLTAGASAGSRWLTIKPGVGNLEVRVLLDSKNQPVTAVATVRFTAIATGRDGTKTALFSDARYVLRVATQGWRIVAFTVDRADHPLATGSSPSLSPSAATS